MILSRHAICTQDKACNTSFDYPNSPSHGKECNHDDNSSNDVEERPWWPIYSPNKRRTEKEESERLIEQGD